MAITIKIWNGGAQPSTYNAKNGFVYKDQLNETRDSATVVVRTHGGHRIDVEPFDFVEIEGTSCGKPISKKSFLVDGYYETQASFGEREDFDVAISMFSETKEMERVCLPNLAITSKADGTKRSVFDYIGRYFSVFAPEKKTQSAWSESGYSVVKNWTIDPSVIMRFRNVDVPEMSWNCPTLSEVITDLMEVDWCIPKIEGHVLKFVDLRAKGEEIDRSRIVSARRSMSSSDYNQSLVLPLKNAIGKNPTRVAEWTSFRNDAESVLTTRNMQVLTQKPIYEIRKVLAIKRCTFTTEEGVSADRLFKVDITKSVKEKKAYDALYPNTVKFSVDDFEESASTHQISNVYFNRGSNAIEGFGKEWDFGFSEVKTSAEIVILNWFEVQKPDGYHRANFKGEDLRDVMFYVEYDTLGEATLEAGKSLPLRNSDVSSFDGQTSSYVDFDRQGIVEYAKANRISNKIVEIDGVYKDEAELPKLGQTFGGAVIFSREIQYFDDSIIFHGTAADNYVLMNFFAGVRAKHRSWAISSGNEAFSRVDVVKRFAEFSFSEKKENLAGKMILPPSGSREGSGALMESLVSPLYRVYNDGKVKYCAYRTSIGNGKEWLPSGERSHFISECSAEKAGKSIVLSVNLKDNYSAGVSSSIEGDRRLNAIEPYADRFGEFIDIDAKFLTFYDPADGEFTWPEIFSNAQKGQIQERYVDIAASSETNSLVDKMKDKARKKPISSSISTSDVSFGEKRRAMKDNREIYGISEQIEFCSDTPDIVVGDAFCETQELVSSEQESPAGLVPIAGILFSASSLPPASENYEKVGFAITNLTSVAFAKKTTMRPDGYYDWEWSYQSANPSSKFAILDGYDTSTSPRWPGAGGTSRRYVVARIDFDAGTMIDREQSCFVVPLIRKATEADKTDEGLIAPTAAKSKAVKIEVGRQNARITVGIADDERNEAWAIVDANDRLLIACNDPTKKTIYMNLVSSRDATIRKSMEELHVVVGSIEKK